MDLQERVPSFLWELLTRQYGENNVYKILTGYQKRRPVTLRINTIRSETRKVKTGLEKAGISYEEVLWSEEALIIKELREEGLRRLPFYEKGEVYLQSLSSMLPPILLEPKGGECILDMAAAPGGKTTQMAALSGNRAQITACEKNKMRAQRLKFNLERQGASHVCVIVTDSRKLEDMFAFDKILLDAPCSGSGTLRLEERGLKEAFTRELVERSARTQEALLKKALKLLKPGHEMIYSTCSILEQENERIVKQATEKGQAEVVPIDVENLKGVPLLPSKIPGTVCVCPDGRYEGFFMAKLRRV